MAMVASRRLLPAAALAGALALAGCGGGSGHGASTAARSPDRPATPARSGAFAWLRPAAPPAGWTVARLPSGTATLAYPPGWRSIHTDPGTFSAALLGPKGRIHGYLNATPLAGAETLANWARFRPAHNREEGDREVVTEAAGTDLRFRTGTGSCVVDRYATISARYREIACIVRGARATTVIVAAAQPRDWARLAPALRRSIGGFST
jgi:hypothetical protein